HQAGHEFGCTSYWHRLIYQQTVAEFRQDLRRAKQAIEDAAGQPVEAYRAPSFSITRSSIWALEALIEEGFKIDSSIFPAYHDRYGIADAEPRIHQIKCTSGCIWERSEEYTSELQSRGHLVCRLLLEKKNLS